MNLDTIDEFLFIKAIKAIDAYFLYMDKGFQLIDSKAKEIPKEREHLTHEYFGKKAIEYQVVATTFVSEVFHVVETYLKSNLLRSGEYLIYPSIDKYPEHKEKLEKFNETEKNEVTNVLVGFAKAIAHKKENRIQELSKRIGRIMFSEPKELLVNSITCSEALFRLEKFLNWEISDEAKERFRLFIENRNEIIHFNKLTNLTFACSHSMSVLVSLSGSNPEIYPLFSTIPNHLKDKLDSYNIIIQEILFNVEREKVLSKTKDNAKAVNDVLASNSNITQRTKELEKATEENREDKGTYTKAEKQQTHKNAYERWSTEDDEKLELLFCEGKSVKELEERLFANLQPHYMLMRNSKLTQTRI